MKLNIGTTVTNLFTVLGAIGTLLSTYIVYYAYFTETNNLTSSGVSRIQEAAATIVAPKGFIVTPANISKIPSNKDFSLGINMPVLITDDEIPFIITARSSDNNALIKVNGKIWGMRLGDTKSFRNSGCQIWLYSIQNDIYSFKMDCT
ncbi:MAG: hypothetical protein ABW098_17525 [Candidatus Thiodiazotropha sp.]